MSYHGLLFLKSAPSGVIHREIDYKGRRLFTCVHNWHNVEALIKSGVRTPAPAGIENWKYPGRYTPMQHQKVTTKFLVDNPKSFVLSAMRTGKTAATIWAIEYLMQQGVAKKVLIVCPLSVLKVWVDEIFNLIPHRTGVVLYGSKEKRLDLLSDDTEYCIINHDGVSTIYEQLKKTKFDIIVADEAAVYRNINKRYRKFKEISTTAPRLWLLTGTPTPNAPTDAFGLIKIVTPEIFTGSAGAFKELTMRKVSMFKWVPKANASETVRKFLQPAIRFSLDECMDAPKLAYVNRVCELTPEQAKAFVQMKKQMIMERVEGATITAANAAVVLTKLIQIACGVVKDNEKNPHLLDAKHRMDLLEECILEAGRKAIVFVPFIAVQENIYQFLKAAGFECEIVNGNTSKGAREAIFERFQIGHLDVIIAHPKVTAHGIDLTAASTSIWFGPTLSPEQWVQANARIEGPKQKHKCTIVRIGSTPLEWRLYDALNGKVQLQDMLLESYKEIVR